jgi:pyruvate, water dikinase
MHINDLIRFWAYRLFAPGVQLKGKYEAFRQLLEHDSKCHQRIAELQQLSHDRVKIDFTGVEARCKELSSYVSQVVASLIKLHPVRYADLLKYFNQIDSNIKLALSPAEHSLSFPFVLGFAEINPDMSALVGNKALRLATACKMLKLPVPKGFVITSNAFNHFIEASRLRAEIDRRLSRVEIGSYGSLERESHELMELVLNASVPEDLALEITKAVHGLQECAPEIPWFCVRSSGVGEDGRYSYAGQYASVLNIPANEIVPAYKRVIASKYSERSLYYRIIHGDMDRETPMAALVMQMVNAKVSGVVYTGDATEADADALVIYSLWGLAKLLVSGAVTPAITRVSKARPLHPESQSGALQEVKAVPSPQGGTQIVPCHEEQAASSALSFEFLANLAEWAIRLEEFNGRPQDIEWCMDHGNELFVLQARSLVVEVPAGDAEKGGFVQINNPVLLSGGVRASAGIASGVVYNLEREADLRAIPDGAVLVARSGLPDYAIAMGRISALVTDVGSVAGHLVTIAREFGVPALVNTRSATEDLATGRIVTVHADNRIVYEGIVENLQPPAKPTEATISYAESPAGRKLERALEYISPLNLLDPGADHFAPHGCRTFHDILRFSHEQSIIEMFSLGKEGSRRARGAKRLRSDIPMVVYLLDLGGGIDEVVTGEKEVPPDAIRCVPFKSLWKGLSHPDIYWDPDIVHFNWKELDRLSHGLVQSDSIQLGSYAIVSGDYLNFHIHFGYHFVVVDTLCTPESEHNYLKLRFAGGGAQATSRHMRVRFLELVLSHLGFKIERKLDLIDGQMNRNEQEQMMMSLEMVGILLGCTRVLDMALKDGSQVDEMVSRFLSGDYGLSPLSRR